MSALLPVAVAVIVLATDAWIYLDAEAHEQRREPVVLRIGTLQIDSPVAWVLCATLMWVITVPLYLASRRPL